MMHTLEWSHAFTGRLRREAVLPLAARADTLATEIAARLRAGELPFLNMPYRAVLEEVLQQLKPRLQSFRHMVVLGIGGSALGARALQRAFAPGQDSPCHTGPWLWIADNVCPATLEDWLEKLPLRETLVVCISKSGGTIETLSQYFLFRRRLREVLGTAWRQHVIIVTDATRGFLRQEATEQQITALEVPDFLGGRYSVLSAVGLIPALFLGMDTHALLEGAASVARPLVEDMSCLAKHPAFTLAQWAVASEQHGYDQLIFFSYLPRWATFGPWFAQLWAESLGKEGKGSMPLPAVGVTDQHSIQQMFLDGPRNKACLFLTSSGLPDGPCFPEDLPEKWKYLRGRPFASLLEAEGLGTRMALAKRQTPMVHLHLKQAREYDAGALMMLLEAMTVFAGLLMDINPLDQPAVELGKRLANARLGADGYAKEKQDLAAYLDAAEDVQAF